MGSPWPAWDDMPPLVDANVASHQAPRTIPPPPGAAVVPSRPPPRTAYPGPQQYALGTPWPQHPFPSPQDPYAPWRQWYDATAYPQQSGPSPYIPRQPLHPETRPQEHSRRRDSEQSSRKRSNSFHMHFPWPSEGGDLSPLQAPTRTPDMQSFAAPRALDMSTPSSSLSHSVSSSSSIPPGVYHERPQQWRHDFKFKSGFASMFRNKSSTARPLDGVIDSAKLDLYPVLRYSKSRPLTVYDLRREPLTLMFRELDRPPLANDMDHPVTRPPTQYMRIYHPRLPWYIDIRANGAPYISLADFFQQLFAALNKPISKYDYYNNELDDEDRDALTHSYIKRCRTEDERMEGVKRVDFLRGKIEWKGLIAGKNGMWRLKTA